jgi:radical SAM-linked protein
MRIGLEFAKTDAARYISHLDLQRAFSRAIRRSGLPVKLSEGFNPHYVVSFASALALGMESTCECVEMALAKNVAPDEFLIRMAKALPPGLNARRAVVLGENKPKLMAALRVAEYTIDVDGNAETIVRAVSDVLAEAQVMADKTAKGVTKTIDIRSMIDDIWWRSDGRLMMRLSTAPEGALRPELVLDVLKQRAGAFEYRVTRTGLFTCDKGELVDLLGFCQSV